MDAFCKDKMVEVFKTDVNNVVDAERILGQLHAIFEGHEANFDLEDCDLILRVDCKDGVVNGMEIIELLKENGFFSAILADDVAVIN